MKTPTEYIIYHVPHLEKYCKIFPVFVPYWFDQPFDSKQEFLTVWKHFAALQVQGETAHLTELYKRSYDSHRARISGLISGYEIGLVAFSKCWEALGWAIAWYLQSKIKMIP